MRKLILTMVLAMMIIALAAGSALADNTPTIRIEQNQNTGNMDSISTTINLGYYFTLSNGNSVPLSTFPSDSSSVPPIPSFIPSPSDSSSVPPSSSPSDSSSVPPSDSPSSDPGTACPHANTEPIGNEIPAGCENTGKTAGKRCSDCGKTLEQQKIIPPTGHRTYLQDAVEPTCTQSGLTMGSYCPDCGEVYGEQQVIPALGHDYKVTVEQPTCTEGGETDHLCARCADAFSDNRTAALSHWFGLWSSVGEGAHTATCRRDDCGYVGTKDCAPIETVQTDKTISVCPVCGRSGDKVYEIIEGAKLTGVDRFAIKRGETVIRGMNAPTEGVLYAFTLGQEYSGILEPFQGTVRASIPLDASLEGFSLTMIPALEEAAAPVPVEYTIENGLLIFETDQPGLFLLSAA